MIMTLRLMHASSQRKRVWWFVSRLTLDWSKESLPTKFSVVGCPSACNAITGIPWIHETKTVSSTNHHTIYLQTKWGIREIKGEVKKNKKMLQDEFQAIKVVNMATATPSNVDMYRSQNQHLAKILILQLVLKKFNTWNILTLRAHLVIINFWQILVNDSDSKNKIYSMYLILF